MVGLVWLDYSYTDGMFQRASVWVVLLTLFAGLSMVAQARFWSFKEINPRLKVPFIGMIGLLLFLMIFILEPALVLFAFFFGYSLSGYIMWAWRKLQRRRKSTAE